MENKEEKTIDLNGFINAVIEHKKECVGIIVACTFMSGVCAWIIPDEYRSTTLVQISSEGKNVGNLSELANVMGIGKSSNDSAANYIELMKTRHVLEPVIDSLEWDDEKVKPSVGSFAKKNLDIQNVKKTNLIQITGKGKNPEEAQKISQGVVDSFLAMQTEMNQQTQSLLIKFLTERIELAKKESEEAEKKLSDYSKEHKIYSPDEQIQSALSRLDAFDKSIGDMEVDSKSARAQYDAASSRLGDQKARSKHFRINDNASVADIRGQIIKKQIELVELQSKFTEENPQIIQARKDLEKLNQVLVQEVDMAVDSQTVSVSTVYDDAIKQQVEAEAKIAVSEASIDALKSKRVEKEEELKNLPDGAMEYIQLKSDSELKQKVYLSLVQECEKDRVQEAMKSMDIQVIDKADLPKTPSYPNSRLFIIIGCLIGFFISLTYSLFKLNSKG